jgi:transposase
MAVYKSSQAGQGTFFVQINLSRQLKPGTFEFTLNQIVNSLDISCFDNAYRNDKTGAPAISPAILLKIVFYCYARGVISSRKIMAMCEDNIIVKALSGDIVPHWTTIASFISTNGEAMKKVFSQVLLYCSELGLIQGDIFAIDGCKLPSNASKEWSGTIADLKKKKEDLEVFAKKLIEQHKAKDKTEGETGKESGIGPKVRAVLPEETEKQYRNHIKRIRAKIAYIDEFFETQGEEPRIGSGGGRSAVQYNG